MHTFGPSSDGYQLDGWISIPRIVPSAVLAEKLFAFRHQALLYASCDMARSANDSFELANSVLHKRDRGRNISGKKAGSTLRSQLARQQSNRARKSSDAHSRDLGTMKKLASEAAENVTAGRERQRKREVAKSERTK